MDFDQKKARIFRITHVDNVAWALKHGLDCRSAALRQPDYHEIGNPDLIAKRADRPVPIAPGGMLSDYVPFYFTPFSPMLFNIKTGYGGVKKVPLDDIVIFVTDLHKLVEKKVPFVFSDRHAYLQLAEFFSDIARLDRIDWKSLNERNFKRDALNLGRFERYQAEALVHRHLPSNALTGILCRSKTVETNVRVAANAAGIGDKVLLRPGLFF